MTTRDTRCCGGLSVATNRAASQPGPSPRNVGSNIIAPWRNFAKALTDERLFGWHFPTGFSNIYRITVGGWRADKSRPMQVVLGRIGNQKMCVIKRPRRTF